MKRYKHNLGHYKLLSLRPGELVPIGCVHVIPGDTFQHGCSVLLRASPLLAPVMHPFHVRVHHFYVPYRLLWSGWEDFITGVSATPPPVISANFARSNGDLLDHLGVPPVQVAGQDVSAFPVYAYNTIWNECFRDQDLQTEVAVTDTNVLPISWGKDNFTTARPWTQKGTAITIPLGTSAPVKTQGTDVLSGAQSEMRLKVASTGNTPAAATLGVNATNQFGSGGASLGGLTFLYPSNLYADLASAASATPNAIRLAFALQRYQEARAQYGSRFTEYLRYLGVKSSDARLQRPEYLGGGKQTISFSEVLQTAEGANVVGTMRGHGISGMRTRRYRRFFEEHGVVLSLMSVRPKSIYVNGLHREWNKTTKEDYWQKELQEVGQQAIKNKEIYFANDGATNDTTFGYGNRYQEYKEHPSMVHGDFRSSTLNFWHAGRIFSSRPSLNAAFIAMAAADTNRIFAVSTNDTLWCAVNHSLVARRLVKRGNQARII